MHDNATYQNLKHRAAIALMLKWGSDEQIAAENEFFAELENCVGELGEQFQIWCLKATTEEIVHRALHIAAVRLGLEAEEYSDLIEEYTKWTIAKGHPQLSADELWYELTIKRDNLSEDIKWLSDFIKRWEEAE